MYEVVIQPNVDRELTDFTVRCTLDHGEKCAENMIAAFEKAVELLGTFPLRGVNRLKYIPDYYRAVRFWEHKWLIYQIEEERMRVYIDFLIDDRSNYGVLLK